MNECSPSAVTEADWLHRRRSASLAMATAQLATRMAASTWRTLRLRSA